MSGTLASHAAALLDWLWPPVCPRCGARAAEPRAHFCEACWCSLEPLTPAGAPPPLDIPPGRRAPVLAAFVVNSHFLDVLATSKYRRYRAVGQRLAFEAARVLQPRLREASELPGAPGRGRGSAGEAGAGSVAHLVPVPLASVKMRERGFNQTEDFARALASPGFEPAPALLARRRSGRALAGQAREKRAAAVAGAFVAGAPDLSGAGRLVVVDDVVTTGATLSECARVLSAAGGDVAGFLAMGCALPGRDAPPPDRSLLGRL